MSRSNVNPLSNQNTTGYYSPATLRRLLRFLLRWRRWPVRLDTTELVECLRSIAEVVIWGDQNDADIVSVFREEDGLSSMLRILRRKENRSGSVAVQMLQTFAMLIQNVKDRHCMMYFLNHQAVREVISTPFDFEDEDVVGYYVSFVKSISLKLNESTVTSFTRGNAKTNSYSMPLFSEAIKFVNHSERMVRSAARTLTLTIISLKSHVVDRFFISDENRCFFKDQITYLINQSNLSLSFPISNDSAVQLLDGLFKTEGKANNDIERLQGEIEDIVCYLCDIYQSGRSLFLFAFLDSAFRVKHSAIRVGLCDLGLDARAISRSAFV